MEWVNIPALSIFNSYPWRKQLWISITTTIPELLNKSCRNRNLIREFLIFNTQTRGTKIVPTPSNANTCLKMIRLIRGLRKLILNQDPWESYFKIPILEKYLKDLELRINILQNVLIILRISWNKMRASMLIFFLI